MQNKTSRHSHHHRRQKSNNSLDTKNLIIIVLSILVYLVYLYPCFTISSLPVEDDSSKSNQHLNQNTNQTDQHYEIPPEPSPSDKLKPTPTDEQKPTPTDEQKPTPTDKEKPTPTDKEKPTPKDKPEPSNPPEPVEFSSEYMDSVHHFVKNIQNKVNQIMSKINEELQNLKEKVASMKTKSREDLKKLEKYEEILTQERNLDTKQLNLEFGTQIENRVKNGPKIPLVLISMESQTESRSIKVSDVIFSSSTNRASKEIKASTEYEFYSQMRCIKGPNTKFTFTAAFPEKVTEITINYTNPHQWPVPSAIKRCKITALFTKETVFTKEVEIHEPIFNLKFDQPIRFEKLIVETIDSYGNTAEQCIDEIYARIGQFVN